MAFAASMFDCFYWHLSFVCRCTPVNWPRLFNLFLLVRWSALILLFVCDVLPDGTRILLQNGDRFKHRRSPCCYLKVKDGAKIITPQALCWPYLIAVGSREWRSKIGHVRHSGWQKSLTVVIDDRTNGYWWVASCQSNCVSYLQSGLWILRLPAIVSHWCCLLFTDSCWECILTESCSEDHILYQSLPTGCA